MYKSGQPDTRSSPLANQIDMRTADEEEEEEEEAADGIGALPSSSTSSSMPPPPPLSKRRQPSQDSATTPSSSSRNAFSPLSSDDCFAEGLEVDVPERGVFRVYYTPPRPKQAKRQQRQQQQQQAATSSRTGPGISPRLPGDIFLSASATAGGPMLSDPALVALQLPDMDDDDDEEGEEAGKPSSPGTLIFLHHGAGFSGLSFALTARAITHSTNGEVGVLALDCRGHGRTECPAPEEMSLETLTGDSFALLQTLFPDPARTPTLLLVGHSMGGGVVVSLCPAVQNWGARVAGVAVLDVVEGTAVEALSSMEGIVAMQPKGFDSMEEAIRWHVERGSAAAIRNKESARRSVPGVLKVNPNFREEPQQSTEEDRDEHEAIEELKDEDDTTHPLESASREPRLIFRHNLSLTTPHWRSWFVGLSQRFLGVRTARLLMLAGTDRLDKDLMVGQMQGKYQLQVLPEAGHCLMEDEPEKVAKLLVDFWRRNEVVNLPVGKGVQLRKVGQ